MIFDLVKEVLASIFGDVTEYLVNVAIRLVPKDYWATGIAAAKYVAPIIVTYFLVRWTWDSSWVKVYIRRIRHSLPLPSDSYADRLSLAVQPISRQRAKSAFKAMRDSIGGKGFISLRQYLELIDKNKNVANVIVDDDGKMVGYFDIFPLTNTFGQKFVEGSATEKHLNEAAVHAPSDAQESDYIYIGAIFNTFAPNSSGEGSHADVTRALNEHLFRHVMSLYPPASSEDRVYVALAAPSARRSRSIRNSDINVKLANLGFSLVDDGSRRKDRSAVYVLRTQNIFKTVAYVKRHFPSLIENQEMVGPSSSQHT